ncbi:MAG: TauD/TfdA family dioxygenase [Actinomycetota bacterium]
MDRHDVPPAHVDSSLQYGLGSSPADHDTLPSLPFPDAVQQLVDDRSPFVLTLGDAHCGPMEHDAAGFAALQISLARSIGVPYEQVAGSADTVIQDVFPDEHLLDAPNTSAGAHAPFGFHSDKSCSAHRGGSPDWVTLACVRNSERSATRVASLHAIARTLDPATEESLAAPTFRFGSDSSNVGPILTRDARGRLRIRLSTDMTPLTPAATDAYDALTQAVAAVAEDVVLAPGDILFLPNWACVHGRTAFTPHPEPSERRLLHRIYIRAAAA